MAMTKAEQARVALLERDLAFRWPTAAEPVPMTREEIVENKVKLIPRDRSVTRERMATPGWVHNAYSERVEQAWSDGMYHSCNVTGDNGSQGMGRLYRTKADAVLAMRWEMCRSFAAKLRAVDLLIDGAST